MSSIICIPLSWIGIGAFGGRMILGGVKVVSVDVIILLGGVIGRGGGAFQSLNRACSCRNAS